MQKQYSSLGNFDPVNLQLHTRPHHLLVPGPMVFDPKGRTEAELLSIYEALLTPRVIEERMLLLLRQGKISKWFSGIGQEAVSVGAALLMQPDEYILTVHRNLGVFTVREVPMDKLFEQFQGKGEGFTKGRDRSFHFGSQEHRLVGMISHLGAQLGVADGIALSHVLRKERQVTLVFTGDGGTSEGDFHEALNVASVWNLPVIFLIENNGYGLSTPSHEQFNIDSFLKKGPAYGVEACRVDGNNILEILNTLQPLIEDIRQHPRPLLVEAVTFRMRGHEEASGTKYVPATELAFWKERDPVDRYHDFLVNTNVTTSETLKTIRDKITKQVLAAVKRAFAAHPVIPNTERELQDVYAPYISKTNVPATITPVSKRYVDAIKEGLEQSLERFPDLVLMGQDIAEYGGVFKVTEGFVERFGSERIRNTPLCESAILGAAFGLSITGIKSIVEMQFADFVSCGFNQIVNNLAKSHYRWGQCADVVVRLPTGAGMGAGPFHSQSTEAWFFHVPGLKIVYPSTPADAKGLLCAAIEDPNPVLFFEHKLLYRSLEGEVPSEYYTIAIGEASLVRQGYQLSIIAYGMAVHWAKELCEELQVDADILDLRSLQPWDREAVRKTVIKTNKVLIAHEDTLAGGIGAEISSWISEHCFQYLDAPVMRAASLETPVPFSTALEENYLPKFRMKDKILELMRY